MMMTTRYITVLLVLLVVASGAQAQTLITALPARLTVPGTYELRGPLSYYGTSGAAISIEVDHVTLDLGDDALLLPGGSSTTAVGVELYGRTRVTIRRGAIRGALYGVRAESCSDLLLEDLDVSAGYIGVTAMGEGTRVVRCRASHTGWTTLPGYTRPRGFRIAGDGARLLDSAAYDILHPSGGESMGVDVVFGLGVQVEGCVFARSAPVPFSYGGWTNAGDTFFRENSFTGFDVAIGVPSGAGAVALSNAYSRCTTTGVGP